MVSGMWLGASFLALHMSLTHSITLSMIGSYMPTGEVKGVGKLSGTAWSVTDFILGKSRDGGRNYHASSKSSSHRDLYVHFTCSAPCLERILSSVQPLNAQK